MRQWFAPQFSLAVLPLLMLPFSKARRAHPILPHAWQKQSASTVTDTTLPTVTLLPSQGQLVPLLATAAQQARDRSLTPVLLIGGTWCESCRALDQVLASSAMRSTMQRMYLIRLDWRYWNRALAKLGVDVYTSIPRVVALDATGRPVREPWRTQDETDSLQTISLQHYFEGARQQFAQEHTGATEPSKRQPKQPTKTGGTP